MSHHDQKLADALLSNSIASMISRLEGEIASAQAMIESLEGMSPDHVVQSIIRKHAKRAGVTPTKLKGLSRVRVISNARQDAWREIRNETTMTLKEIGRMFSLM